MQQFAADTPPHERTPAFRRELDRDDRGLGHVEPEGGPHRQPGELVEHPVHGGGMHVYAWQ
ncbi:hypothetical protein ACFXB4_00610 [Streptomyces lavendulae]|uniref:hypothetical protein n=1 Tax=Streptomyces lavendulae TaxID=1914 RepID=UPI0036BAFDB2